MSAAELKAHREGLERLAPELEKIGFNVTPTSEGRELRLYGSERLSMTARVQPDLSVHVDRISSMPLEKFKRIAAILAE